MKKKTIASQSEGNILGSKETFNKPVFFSGLLHLLLHLHFNPIILLHPNVDGTFMYNWTKHKLDLRSLQYP